VTFWVPEDVLLGDPVWVAASCTVPDPGAPETRGTITSMVAPPSRVMPDGAGVPTDATAPAPLAVMFQGPELDGQPLLTTK